MSKKKQEQDLVKNRKAFHDFEILETHEAGLVLQGTEVKSLKNHGGSLQDAFASFEKGELWLINSNIAPYSFGNVFNHEERRKRKLLLHKNELQKLKKQIKEKGLTIVPLCIYLKKGKIKIKIGIAKGKRAFDKRQAVKKKEQERSIRRELA